MKLTNKNIVGIIKKIQEFVDYHEEVIGHCSDIAYKKGFDNQVPALLIMGLKGAYVSLDFDSELLLHSMSTDFNEIVKKSLIKQLKSFDVDEKMKHYLENHLIDELPSEMLRQNLIADKKIFLDRADTLEDFCE